MTPNQIIEHFGSQSEAARALNVTRQVVNNWVARGRSIPYLRQLAIQAATKGKLKACIDHAPQHERKQVAA